jgi:uncharacterized protein (DUF58 family)
MARVAPPLPSAAELERAARVLAVRSRREVSSAFAGGYRSAFRGGGIEFEESRPYAPGDDVRHFDWNALARTGSPYVKRFREERDQTVLLAVDVSRSMAFASGARSKAALAAHAAALVAGAALRAGDRVGLLAFAEVVRDEVAPERGEAHLFHLLARLAAAAAAPDGGTDLASALASARGRLRRHAVVLVFSDFRDETLFAARALLAAGRTPERLERGALAAPAGGVLGPLGGAALLGPASSESAARRELVRLARRHDLVAAVVSDAREEELPAAGAARLADPEAPGATLLLRTTRRVRERYAEAAAARRSALERALRAGGADALFLRTDRDPLRALARFFGRRPARARRVAA